MQVDGQLKTGRDVVVAALLGAEEFGFATAPLIVAGCVMMRVCHLDTCPVGIATQNPVLRERFTGKPEFVENFFLFLAEEVRELPGRAGLPHRSTRRSATPSCSTCAPADRALEGARARPVAGAARARACRDGAARRRVRDQDHGLDRSLDNELIALAAPALADGAPVRASVAVRNEHRSVGAMLGGEVTRRFGGTGLPDDTIEITLHGTAGQSFGAFLPRGVTLRLFGDANDYVGKGLSGGRLVVRPDAAAPFAGRGATIIAGNTILYGATGGELFLRGRVGRAVRRAQLRRDRGRRGRRRPRLRVHDRRHRGGARPDRAQLRRRHVRRHGVRAGGWTRGGSTGSWSTWTR